MNGDRARLDELIEAVADGAPIDWNAVEAAADARDRRRIRYLRLVADLAQGHASQALEPDERLVPRGGTDGAQTVTWGHLQLAETIGDGQFGVVYRAHDPWLDRDVAVKLLKCNGSDASVPRILQEARTLARVRHPNVVTVHGADEHDGHVGLTMEWIRGRTLESVLASQGPFGAAEAAVIGHDVCRALAAVHGAGLVHRDVKAANVMREVGGRLVLMDFGAGLMRTAAPAESGALAGTPLYLGPEVSTEMGRPPQPISTPSACCCFGS